MHRGASSSQPSPTWCSVEKNDKAARESTMAEHGEGLLNNITNDDQPLGFIVGLYIFIIFVFEVILGAI